MQGYVLCPTVPEGSADIHWSVRTPKVIPAYKRLGVYAFETAAEIPPNQTACKSAVGCSVLEERARVPGPPLHIHITSKIFGGWALACSSNMLSLTVALRVVLLGTRLDGRP